MNPHPLSAFRPPAWRRIGAVLALAASLGFAFQTTLLAQVSTEPDVPVQTKPKAPVKHVKKHVPKVTPTDNVADELNRRESERIAKLEAAPAKPADAKPLEANPSEAKPTPAKPEGQPAPTALPANVPAVSASLTPTVAAPPPAPATAPPTRLTAPDVPAPAPQIREAQTRPTPVPVPAPPGAQPAPPSVTGAPGRAFAQSQVVPPQQPTLSLEIQKGTAIKLPGAAATVFVASPDIADVQVKSPSMIYVFAKKPGDTVLYAVDDQDRVLLNTIVSVSSPISRMRATFDALHPGNTVQFENQGDSIVLTGTVRSAVTADDARRIALQHVNGNPNKVINNLRVDAPNQVQLRVKVAEVHREALKRIGVNWQNITNGSVGVAPFIGALNSGFAIATSQSTGGTASAVLRFTGGNFDALIDLLATQNQATILAEPNLIAMSGETASFLAGGEFPILLSQSLGSTTVEYKSYGVSLAFTPIVLADGRISMRVRPEVSELSTEGAVKLGDFSVPALVTRRAETTVELGSGQSFMIAGLLKNTNANDLTKTPFLGDIPILGALFRSTAFKRAETELVIIVTPYLVRPVSHQMATPVDGYRAPTDTQQWLGGQTFTGTTGGRLPQAVPASPAPAGSVAAPGFKL